MKKVKLVTTLAMTVVMLVMMAGLAAAEEIYTFEDVGVYDQYGNLLSDVTIEIYNEEGDLLASATTHSTVTVTVPSDPPERWCLNIVHEDEVIQMGCYAIPAEIEDFKLALYNLMLQVGGDDEIPEFSTIALPVATILGLLFFFNYRKRRNR